MTALELAARVRQGDLRALARAISVVENEAPRAGALVGALHPYTGHAAIVGLTGPPGAGKSTLADRMALEWRAAGLRVGILAIDPSSPFTGGALLGDRIRMQRHAGDGGVYIRSMATRGHLGGLARATADAALVLDAAGYGVVLIETVGVGQDEIDVVRAADVSIVVVVPGTGDDVQALKAGIMEIADIYVVNKADREGAERTAATIEALLSLHAFTEGEWRPPIVRTQASSGDGVAVLIEAIDRFRHHSERGLMARRRARTAARVKELLARELLALMERELLDPGEFEALLDRIASREIDPHTVATQLAARLLRRG